MVFAAVGLALLAGVWPVVIALQHAIDGRHAYDAGLATPSTGTLDTYVVHGGKGARHREWFVDGRQFEIHRTDADLLAPAVGQTVTVENYRGDIVAIVLRDGVVVRTTRASTYGIVRDAVGIGLLVFGAVAALAAGWAATVARGGLWTSRRNASGRIPPVAGVLAGVGLLGVLALLLFLAPYALGAPWWLAVLVPLVVYVALAYTSHRWRARGWRPRRSTRPI